MVAPQKIVSANFHEITTPPRLYLQFRFVCSVRVTGTPIRDFPVCLTIDTTDYQAERNRCDSKGETRKAKKGNLWAFGVAPGWGRYQMFFLHSLFSYTLPHPVAAISRFPSLQFFSCTLPRVQAQTESRNYRCMALFKFSCEKRPRAIVSWFRLGFRFSFRRAFWVSSSTRRGWTGTNYRERT